MPYTALTLFIDKRIDTDTDLIIAQLSMAGFEGFEEEDNKVIAYINTVDYSDKLLQKCSFYKNLKEYIRYEVSAVADINWNSMWESNFEPVQVENCIVRAPFHEKPLNIDYDIVIEPKMSFGTGHHETTSLIIQAILHLPLANLQVLDMGCGTGVLAILAAMKNAAGIDAVDNDVWAYENTLENIKKNNSPHINVFHGAIETVRENTYDVIIANITRNTLLELLAVFAKMQNTSSSLLLSGFYVEDAEILKIKAADCGYAFKNLLSKNNWAVLEFIKQ